MLRITILILLASTSFAGAQIFERRQPTTIFGSDSTITTIIPTPGGFFAGDTQGNMATGVGGVIVVAPQATPRRMAPVPLSPSVQLPRTSFDNW